MILIYATELSPRLKYILGLIFRDVFQVNWVCTDEIKEYEAHQGPKIFYAKGAPKSGISILPMGLLAAQKISTQKIEVGQWRSLPCFFLNQPQAPIAFDLFAACFYLTSRYEEYLDFEPDPHGRFEAKQSLAYRAGFLEWPLVNYWLKELQADLEKEFPDFVFPKRSFSFSSTLDVDNAYAYRLKGILRTSGAISKDLIRLDFNRFSERFEVFWGGQRDPYDTYDYVLELHKKNNCTPLFFFLLGDYSRYDRSVSHRKSKLQKLIRELSRFAAIGIHPSFRSNDHQHLLYKEKARLEKITGESITKSRQHFLRMKFPETYRNLLKVGIIEDYSMGYASQIGFRASICNSYYFYDLKAEHETSLRIHPFAVMDATLNRYMGLSINAAIEGATQLMDRVRAVGGEFTILWHNETLSDQNEWKGWREVYETLVNAGCSI